VSVSPAVSPTGPTGRFHLAFGQPTLTWTPTWTRIDSYDSLVTSYTIDRGRQYELDRTDVGRAVVQIADRNGILDPTNSSGPFYGQIQPLLQALVCRQNPVTGSWYTRFRGFVEELDYSFDPSQRVNRLELSLVDIFEFLSAIEMFPGSFGVTPPDPANADQVYYPGTVSGTPTPMDARINQILDNAIGPTARTSYTVVFSGNVNVQESYYSPGESAMTAIQEAADSEFPGVSNVYTDRLGRLAVHGRQAKFDPVGVASGAAAGAWDFHQWQAGDGAAVNTNPAQYAHIRRFGFNRGLAKLINSALATPLRRDVQLTPAQMTGQIVSDSASIGTYGIRSWSAQDLITLGGVGTGTSDLAETKKFATYYVQNYAQPRNRISEIGFRSIDPAAAGASENWRLLSLVDIADTIQVTVASPGGGGFNADAYFVEGVHEQVKPLVPGYDDVTLTLDLSPRAYFATPFPP
jgi:hypothetical protein